MKPRYAMKLLHMLSALFGSPIHKSREVRHVWWPASPGLL
jgi:hypothetical protein